ncbi:FMN-binding protein [Microbacterium sp. B2969]|uniref:FMN-binding protein n=1 Tax=Microbacterium alkaliflavum TaxID=3248839 RepID=A0ABW7QBX1_9MICO
MKRIVYALLATVTGLVLLFSYRTSLEAVAPVAASSTDTSGTTSGSTSSGSTGSDSNSTGSDSSSGSSDSSESSDSSGSDSSGSDSSDSSGSSDSSDSSGSAGSGSSSGSTSSSGLADGTYTGSSANTRFGPVQVQITVSGGVITDAQAVDYPTENRRDQQINQVAIPRLVSETLSAQSADIDMVSGATFTSEGYVQSLQSAIDQANS